MSEYCLHSKITINIIY